jgi:hypothetical protein
VADVTLFRLASRSDHRCLFASRVVVEKVSFRGVDLELEGYEPVCGRASNLEHEISLPTLKGVLDVVVIKKGDTELREKVMQKFSRPIAMEIDQKCYQASVESFLCETDTPKRIRRLHDATFAPC